MKSRKFRPSDNSDGTYQISRLILQINLTEVLFINHPPPMATMVSALAKFNLIKVLCKKFYYLSYIQLCKRVTKVIYSRCTDLEKEDNLMPNLFWYLTLELELLCTRWSQCVSLNLVYHLEQSFSHSWLRRILASGSEQSIIRRRDFTKGCSIVFHLIWCLFFLPPMICLFEFQLNV